LWVDLNNSYLDGCQLTNSTKTTMKKIVLNWKGGAVTTLQKSPSFPQEMADVGYALEHIMDSWWPRRADVGPSQMFASKFEYEPFNNTIFSNRPQLATEVAGTLVNPVGNEYARPPWAWRYWPGNGTSFFQVENRGVIFLDPAVHFRLKHDQPFKWKEWDGTSGVSTQYCFNPYFGIDNRGVWPECSEQ